MYATCLSCCLPGWKSREEAVQGGVCVCARVCVYVCICVCVCMCACVCLCTSTATHSCLCSMCDLCVSVYVRACVCVHTHYNMVAHTVEGCVVRGKYTCVRVCVCVSTRVQIGQLYSRFKTVCRCVVQLSAGEVQLNEK